MHLRVLTYNIHKAVDLNARFKLEPIAEVLRHHDADIVLLQEVTVGARRARHLHLGEELQRLCGYPFQATELNVHFRTGGGYGNCTLSRLPIRRVRNLDLTISWHKRRACLWTTLELPHRTTRLRVGNLHLGLSAGERHRQIERLLHLDPVARLGHDEPLILGGDFNDWRNQLWPRWFRDRGFHYATRHQRAFGIRTFPSYSPLGALDKVFVRGLRVLNAARSKMAITRVASDHLPVIVELELH